MTSAFVLFPFQGDEAWQTELLAEILRDRVGVIEGEAGAGTCAMCVDTSLRMIGGFAERVFMALGVCPEGKSICCSSSVFSASLS